MDADYLGACCHVSLAGKIVEGCEGSCAIFVVPLRFAFFGSGFCWKKVTYGPTRARAADLTVISRTL